MSALPLRVRVASLLRSFMIQGSWNYRTMVGGGFAFALLPVLRHLFAPGTPEHEAALRRHVEHFNAHPYLSALALGAVARLEADGEDPEVIRRFKMALRGPLGGVGDRLVWAALLPTTILLALLAAALGSSIALSLLLFLGLYNGGHLALRIWGYGVGLREGSRVAERLRDARLGRRAEMVAGVGALLLGALTGIVATRGVGAVPTGAFWTVLGGLGLAVGLLTGRRAWRPAAYGVMLVLVLTALWGVVR